MSTVFLLIGLAIIVVSYLAIFKGHADFFSSLGYSWARSLPHEMTEEEKVGKMKMFKFGRGKGVRVKLNPNSTNSTRQ
jgi:hypothetical protein